MIICGSFYVFYAVYLSREHSHLQVASDGKFVSVGDQISPSCFFSAASTKPRNSGCVVLMNGRRENADAVIVATGGISYPSTGSTGDGYRMAETGGT